MTRKRGLGARLASWTAATAAGALLVFGLTAAIVIWGHESAESTDDATGEEAEDPVDEAIQQIGPPIAVTAPIIILLAYVTTRRLARRVTDRMDGVVAAAHRLTHENLAERLPVSPAGDELDELAHALNALFARLDVGLAAQKQFVADASHELRTPLTVLRSDLEVARRRPRTPEEWETVADRARDEVAHMTAMVEALLRLARTGAAPPGDDRVDARALVDEVVARWRAAADAATVGLVVDAAADAAVAGDADALAVALGNLVGNAIAHSPVGGTIRVEARRVGAAVELAVTDQGPGVPAADRERIFLPFARGASAAARVADGGVGLGLSVARRIVEAHRGQLGVGDAPGGGARVVARLPAT